MIQIRSIRLVCERLLDLLFKIIVNQSQEFASINMQYMIFCVLFWHDSTVVCRPIWPLFIYFNIFVTHSANDVIVRWMAYGAFQNLPSVQNACATFVDGKVTPFFLNIFHLWLFLMRWLHVLLLWTAGIAIGCWLENRLYCICLMNGNSSQFDYIKQGLGHINLKDNF